MCNIEGYICKKQVFGLFVNKYSFSLFKNVTKLIT